MVSCGVCPFQFRIRRLNSRCPRVSGKGDGQENETTSWSFLGARILVLQSMKFLQIASPLHEQITAHDRSPRRPTSAGADHCAGHITAYRRLTSADIVRSRCGLLKATHGSSTLQRCNLYLPFSTLRLLDDVSAPLASNVIIGCLVCRSNDSKELSNFFQVSSSPVSLVPRPFTSVTLSMAGTISQAMETERVVHAVLEAAGNPSSVLGVSKDATEQEIKQAYRQLVLQVHPDKCEVDRAADAFKVLREAYSLLLPGRDGAEPGQTFAEPSQAHVPANAVAEPSHAHVSALPRFRVGPRRHGYVYAPLTADLFKCVRGSDWERHVSRLFLYTADDGRWIAADAPETCTCVADVHARGHPVFCSTENALTPGYHIWSTNYATRGQGEDWRHTGCAQIRAQRAHGPTGSIFSLNQSTTSTTSPLDFALLCATQSTASPRAHRVPLSCAQTRA